MTGWHWIRVDLRDGWVEAWVDELVAWPGRLDAWLAHNADQQRGERPALHCVVASDGADGAADTKPGMHR